MMNIYIANISYGATEDGLREAFEQYGEVSSAAIIKDRDTGRSRGFGFVEMPNREEGEKAIENLDGYPLDGRPLKVNEARPREDRGNRGGGGGGGYRGGGGGYGGNRGGGGGYGGGGDRY